MIYNEEKAIASVVQSIMNAELPPNFERHIIAVNDRSTDGTDRVLAELESSYPVHTLSFETRQGLPLSFRAVFDYLRPRLQDEDLVFTLEADGTNNIACVSNMAKEIHKGADVVVASRYATGAKSIGFPWYRLWGSSLINLFLRLLWNVPNIKDYSVLYRVYRGSTLRAYIADPPPFRASKSFAVISEILLQISKQTSKFAEVPLSYDYNLKKGKSKMKLFQTLWEYTRITPRTPLYRQPIFLIAVGAFFLRIWGITYGFPDLLAPDEPALTRGALTMLKLKTLIPALHPADFAAMYYPPVTAYLYLLVLAPVMGIMYLLSHFSSLGDYATQLILDPTPAWITTRIISAFIGAITVYFLGRLAEKMYKGSGVFAALFLATSFLHVFFSHVARHWVLSVLFIVGLLWTSYNIYQSGQKRWYILSGIFGGLAVGTGVVTGILMLAPALAHFFREESFAKKIRSTGFWIMISITGLITALIFALHPLILNNLLAGPNEQGITLTAPKSLYGFAEMAVIEMREFAQSETMILIFGLIGFSFFLMRHKRFGTVLALTTILSIVALYLFHYYLLHYVLLILPIFIFFAGVGAYEIVKMAQTRWMRAAIIIAIFILPALVTLRFSYLWTLPDTRHSARAYIEENVSQQSSIISYVPNMKVVTPERTALQSRLAFDPKSSRLVDQTLLSLATSSYPAPAYSVFEIGTLSSDGVAKLTPQFLASQHFDYAIVDRFTAPYPALEALLAKGEIVARFPTEGKAVNIFADNYGGPALDVFIMRQLGPEIWIVKLSK
ncbi:MAG: glycosyltransferase [Candidatus Paceibacterota bacterium]